jgi:hypothetical protein
MPSFGRRVDGPAGRRRTIREEVVLAASAQSLRSSRPVVVSDVSPTGAKLVGRNLVSLDPEVLISVGEIGVFANVAWVVRDECGVTFDEPLTPDMMEVVKREGGWAKVMGVSPD